MTLPGPHPWGQVPLVVGVLSSASCLSSLLPALLDCDVIELRVDLLGLHSSWREAARRCRSEGLPVIMTLRQAAEGGQWASPEASRLALYLEALPDVDAVDVELRSGLIAGLRTATRAAGVRVIGSFHDFSATPADHELDALVEQGRAQEADVVKLATLTRVPADLDRLRQLPARFPACSLCLLGMGPLGPESRIALPLAGSCLTYGFVDEISAPGQLSASELRAKLIAAHPGYRAWRTERS